MNFVEGFCTSPSPQNTSYPATIATSASRPLSPSASDNVSVAAIVSLGMPPVHREVRVVEVEVAHHQFVGKGGEFRCGALAGEPHARRVRGPCFLRQCPRNRRRLPVLPPDRAPDGVDHEAHLHPVNGVGIGMSS